MIRYPPTRYFLSPANLSFSSGMDSAFSESSSDILVRIRSVCDIDLFEIPANRLLECDSKGQDQLSYLREKLQHQLYHEVYPWIPADLPGHPVCFYCLLNQIGFGAVGFFCNLTQLLSKKLRESDRNSSTHSTLLHVVLSDHVC